MLYFKNFFGAVIISLTLSNSLQSFYLFGSKKTNVVTPTTPSKPSSHTSPSVSTPKQNSTSKTPERPVQATATSADQLADMVSKIPQSHQAPIYINFNPQSNSFNQDIKFFNSQIWTTNFYKDLFAKGKSKVLGFSHRLQELLEPYRVQIGACCVVITYASIQGYLFYLSKKLASQNNWSKWQSTKSLDQFYSMGQPQFSKLLLTDIQGFYITVQNPADFVAPLVGFMKDTEDERRLLISYKRLINVLKSTFIHRLFVYDKPLYENIDLRIQRLSYMKSTFLSWLAEYKLNNSEKVAYRKVIDSWDKE